MSKATENGIKIEIPPGLKEVARLKYYNPRLALLREIVLTTLKIETAKVSDDRPLICLDAFSGSGLTGCQWKRHLGDKVHVILSEQTRGKDNCALNEIEHSDWLLDPSHSTGLWPSVKQKSQQVHICPYKASVILHEEAFNFIFVQRMFNHLALYVDAVFSNIRHNGIACFLTPNMSSPCFRSPKIIQRLFNSYTQKTEYINELAVRVFISDLAKTAARYQKGITVLYTISADDHFLVAVRVARNNQSALSCVEYCRPVLHCLMCEERVVYPLTNIPLENPYSHVPCDCKKRNPGKTAVILGPLWTGDLFSASFIEKLLIETKFETTDTCTKLRTLLNSVLDEALCRGESQRSELDSTQNKEPVTSKLDQSSQNSEESGEPVHKKQKTENGSEHVQKLQESASKDILVENSNKTDIKNEGTNMPLFYYDLQTKKYKIVPKIDKVVVMLRAAGYRACRTHFQHHAIRTNANLRQFNKVVHRLIDN